MSFASLTGKSEEYDVSRSVKMLRGYCGPRTRLSLVLSIINREVEEIGYVPKSENGARILWSLDIIVLCVIYTESEGLPLKKRKKKKRNVAGILLST